MNDIGHLFGKLPKGYHWYHFWCGVGIYWVFITDIISIMMSRHYGHIKQIFFIKIQIEVREISFCRNWWLCPTKHLQRCQILSAKEIYQRSQGNISTKPRKRGGRIFQERLWSEDWGSSRGQCSHCNLKETDKNTLWDHSFAEYRSTRKSMYKDWNTEIKFLLEFSRWAGISIARKWLEMFEFLFLLFVKRYRDVGILLQLSFPNMILISFLPPSPTFRPDLSIYHLFRFPRPAKRWMFPEKKTSWQTPGLMW